MTVSDAELEVIGTRLREVAAFFEFPYRRGEPARTEVGPDDRGSAGMAPAGQGTTGPAENWFDGPADALALAGQLYDAGAERVVVAVESVKREGPGREYADALRLVLPADPAWRSALSELMNREMPQDGYDAEVDTGRRRYSRGGTEPSEGKEGLSGATPRRSSGVGAARAGVVPRALQALA